ncbi:hypothetical protein Lepto7376_0473 [[Leptolyngbya] sp. PCC 7376]|uniref:hypothetical protein n=1 Tax=[Leptolyngbya] sp. PCC 7376 TaxID=111781 RepID=UPI00029F14E9|nr:hypothetical protein [[Leptolyngbya] sp. PCC 7376]AFY36905.1 hypothetical protein Lepto7376_0473 [[Leptolyngbya] sp. PCC 7376]
MVSFLLIAFLWVIALASVYLYQSSDHEVMKLLAISAAAVCIIWGFATTHWGLHLLCLLVLMRYRFRFQLKPIPVDDF